MCGPTMNKDTRELLIFLLALATAIAFYTATAPNKLSDPDRSITCHGPDCMYDYLRPQVPKTKLIR